MSLKKQAASGVKWTGISTVVTTAVQFAQVAVLARLLSPADFGLMGMLLVVVGFAQAFADMGVSNAIIQRQDTTRSQLSSLYWLNMFAGLAVFAVVWASTPLLVLFYHEPRLERLVFWAALTFVITPIGQQFQILLQKELRFAHLAWVEVSAAVVGLIVGVGSALMGHGVFSLIWGQLANTTIKSALLARFGWSTSAPHLRFRRGDLKGYLRFGFYQMGERSINYFNQRVDQLLIGSILGATALGYYTLAFNLVIQPVARINPIITRVAFPVFAKVQNDCARLKRGYMQVISLLCTTNFPLLVGLAALAPVLVPVVFGKQWVASVAVVEVLAFVALFRTQLNPVGSLVLARGRPDLGFSWNAAILVLQVPAIYLGARMGAVTGVAGALLALQALYAVLAYFFLIKPLLGPCAVQYVAGSVPAVWMSAVMGGLVLLMEHVFGEVGIGALWTLISGVLLGAIIYLALAVVFRRDDLREMRELIS